MDLRIASIALSLSPMLLATSDFLLLRQPAFQISQACETKQCLAQHLQLLQGKGFDLGLMRR
jgi:hypothetical protein